MKHDKQFIRSRVTVDKKTGCWIWNGAKQESPNSYGRVTEYLSGGGKRHHSAHRLSFQVFFPNTFDPNLCVLHKCDNRPCVNPKHLFQGTLDVNNKDRANKARSARGRNHPKNKLTERQVREIRRATGSLLSIAKRYRINSGTVSDIKAGKIWKWLN